MVKIIVSGHGGYAVAVKSSIEMIMGSSEGFYFVDLTPNDDLASLIEKLQSAVLACGDDEILFACDLAGGTPFRQCATLCVDHSSRMAVCGLNPSAYIEMVNSLDMPINDLASMAIEITMSTVGRFPK